MDSYKYLSRSYNTLMSDIDYVQWAKYIDSFLKKHGVRSVFEAACGTGSITQELYRLGYSVTASDISSEMLLYAAENARKLGYGIRYVLQDMRKVEVGNKVDAVVCACDGPNYINLSGLSLFASSAANALRSGGLLLFDISSANKLKAMDGQVYFDDREDESCIWQNTYNKTTNTLNIDLTLFVRKEVLFERFTEEHVLYAHETGGVIDVLKNAGFKYVNAFDCFTTNSVREDSQRVQFVCSI